MSQGDQGAMRRSWPIQVPEMPARASPSGATQHPLASNAARPATVSAGALPEAGSRGGRADEVDTTGQATISVAAIL